VTKAVKNGFPVAVLFKKQKPETHFTKVSQAFCIMQQTKNLVTHIIRELQGFESGSLLRATTRVAPTPTALTV
jgi:hypothetical protein